MSLIPFRADLHCHSLFSDGSFSPEELVAQAKKNGLDGLALTDHDTFDGFDDLEKAAKQVGLPVISGAEFSTKFLDLSVHVLSYSFDLSDPSLNEFVKNQEQRREQRVLDFLTLLKKEGINLSLEEILTFRGARGAHSIGRPHLANALVKKGYVKTHEEAFKKWIGEKGRCFVSPPSPPIEEVIEKIHQAKGFAILAHPHLLPRRKEIQELLKFPFDGIEGSYGRMRADQNAPWIAEANKREWMITGGSDFHGTHRPDIYLGASWTDEGTFHDLLYRFNRNSLLDEPSP